jgi:hypothetical protein
MASVGPWWEESTFNAVGGHSGNEIDVVRQLVW